MVQALTGLSGRSGMTAPGVANLSRFTGANDVALTAYTPDKGGGWTANTGTFKIASNAIVPNSNGDGDLSTCAGLADGTLTCLMTPFDAAATASIPGLVFRFTDTSNYWLFQLDSRQNLVQLYQRVAGVFTLRAEYTLTLDSGTAYAVKIILRGNTITTLVNYANESTYVSSFNSTAARIGIRLGKSSTPATTCSWDSFQLQRVTAGALLWPLFVRDAGNPVVPLDAAHAWENSDCANPDVFYDTPNARWVMNYSGFASVAQIWTTCLAYSTDLLTWTKEAANPVLSPTGGEGSIAANGSIAYKAGTYYLVYQGGIAGSRIYLATSPDLLTWTRQNGGNPVLNIGGVTDWDGTNVFDPMLRLQGDGTFALYYGGSLSAVRGIGWATSPDGITWTKQGQLFTSQLHAARNDNLGEPFAALFNGSGPYTVTHDEAVTTGNRFIGQMYLDAAGALHHRKGALEKSAAGWDNVQVFDSCLVLSGGTLHLFYAGANLAGTTQNLNAQIGHASVAWS